MEKLQKKKWIFLIVGVALLVGWIGLGISSRSSSPEKVMYQFLKAWEKKDINKIISCYRPDKQETMRTEVAAGNYLSELENTASEIAKYRYVVGDIEYGEGDDANTAKVTFAMIAKIGNGTSSASTEFETLTLEKIGNRWYVAE
jgi:flagellar basal body-associated protein FliL